MPHLIATIHIIWILESKSWGRCHLFMGTNVFILQSRALHWAFFRLWGSMDCMIITQPNILWSSSIIFSNYEIIFPTVKSNTFSMKNALVWYFYQNKDQRFSWSLWFICWGPNQCFVLFGFLCTEKPNYLIPTYYFFPQK